MALRVAILLIGLTILAAFWTILTYVVWIFFAIFGEIGRKSVASAIIIVGGISSYVYVAARLFGLLTIRK